MARSRSRGGESKQTLVVSLVVFVLMTLLLAVIAFLGYSGQDELMKSEKQAKELMKIAQDNERKEKVQKLLWKLAGGGAEGDDKQNFEDVKNLQSKDIDAEVKKVKLLEWDAEKRAFAKTYPDEIAALKKDRDEERKNRALEREEAKKIKDKLEREVLEKDALVKEANKKRDEAIADVAKQIAAIKANYDATNKKFTDAIEKYTVDQQMIANLTKDSDLLKADIVKLNGIIEKLTARKKELEQKVFADSMLNYEKPKGKVIRIDPKGDTVYLNIGKADLLRTGVTFSIFSPNAFKGSTDAKAKIEVTQIIDDHLSMARVTETKNAVRDPILTGDELYNIGWSPGLRTHVALVGFTALNGDGRDNTAEFVRGLEAQGVVVDRWMNPKERSTEKLKVRDKDKVDELELSLPCKLDGPGISAKTTYVIEADLPELIFQEGGDVKAGNDDKTNLRRAALHILDEATAVGATKVSLRQYLALSGYKAPRTLAPPTESSLGIGRPARGDGDKPKDPPAKPADK